MTFSPYAAFAILLLPAQLLAQADCGSALVIGAGIHTVDTITGAPPTMICAGDNGLVQHGAWYKYTSPMDGSITVTTDLSANMGRDTRMQLYGNQCALIGCVGGDDDSGSGLLSTATVNVAQGNVYYIVFDDRWEPNGFDFQLSTGPAILSPFNFTTVPFTANGNLTGVVDMNNDLLDDIINITATNININHQLPGGGLQSTNIPTSLADHPPIWSLAAGDLDNNGYKDLMYGGVNGVKLMLANNGGSAFTEWSDTNYVFCQRTNMVDINNDGDLDAFACHDVDPNVAYLNDGNGAFIFQQGGWGDNPNGGNYGSIWIDMDNDHDLDLFLSKCSSGIVERINQVHRNNGDGTFSEVAAQFGLADSTQAWSSAWGDFDNDGDLDVMVGASSFMSGRHKLKRNDNGISFVDVTAGSGFDSLSNTGIEHVTHDFDNDGLLDIKSSGDLIMRNLGGFVFEPVTVSANSGPVGDLNNDGFLDIVNPSAIRMNAGNGNHWLKVRTIGTVSNADGIGARVTITSALGTQIRDIVSGDGFKYMSSLTAHFGLAADTLVTEVTVHWPSGLISTVAAPPIDSTITIVEDVSTGIPPTLTTALRAFPNPADEVLNLHSMRDLSNHAAIVYDVNGRAAINTTLHGGALDIHTLRPGVYVLHVQFDDARAVCRFIKR